MYNFITVVLRTRLIVRHGQKRGQVTPIRRMSEYNSITHKMTVSEVKL